MSGFNTPWFNNQDPSFFNSLNISKTHNIVLSGETEDFAEEVSQQWRAEGFNVVYVPMLNGGNDYINRIHNTGNGFGPSEQYAVVGNATSLLTPNQTRHRD